MANGGTIRGRLLVNRQTQQVQLVLAAQDGATAKSMSTAHELLRFRLAEEGYQLNSFVVRHEGREVIRLDTPDDPAMDTSAEGPGTEEREQQPRAETDALSSGDPHHVGPMDLDDSEDPAASGWFL